jgi:hypothetical protein
MKILSLLAALLIGGAAPALAQSPTTFKSLSVTNTLSLPSASITASMLATGAAAANLSTMLPNLSASVEGTGVPGLDGGHWFIWNKPNTYDGTENLRVTRNMPNGSGSSGGTYKSIWGTSSGNPSNLGYEWTIVGEQTHYANVSTGAQNVAVNGTIHRNVPLTWASATTGASGDGTTATITFAGGATIPVGHAVNIAGMTPSGYNGTWKVTASSAGSVSFLNATTGAQTVAGTAVDTSLSYSAGMNGNCTDSTGEADPTGPCIGAEFDVTVNSATTDVNRQRVGVQINANGTSGMHAGRGILLGAGGGITWDRGVEFSGSYGIGADFSGATISGNAVKLAQGQTAAFDTNWTLSSVAGTMAMRYGGSNRWTTDSSGNFNATGNISSSANISANGKVTAGTLFLTTAALPTISTCGTSPPVATAGSSNNGGQFTLGTGATAACTVAFATAYPTTAFCTVTPASAYTGTYYISAQSKTAFTVTLGTGTASAVFNYACNGN